MTDQPIPQPVLAELAAAYHTLMHHRTPGRCAAIRLRLWVDTQGRPRLDVEGMEGIALRSLLAESPTKS